MLAPLVKDSHVFFCLTDYMLVSNFPQLLEEIPCPRIVRHLALAVLFEKEKRVSYYSYLLIPLFPRA